MTLSKNFTLEEFTRTSTGLPNTPDKTVIKNLAKLVTHILQPLRNAYQKPIIVTSGFRSQAVNNAVGGVKSSQHLIGQAADITTGNALDNKRLFNMILQLELPFDQLIDERNYSWIHVSFSPRNRRQVLHLK